MADRSKALQRLVDVQSQMVRRAEWQLAWAERTCRELAEDKARLQTYVIESGALGVPLAKAALRSLHALDERLGEAERLRESSTAALATASLRKQGVEDIAGRVRRVEQRKADDRTLADTVETWLVTRQASPETPTTDASLP